MVKILIRGELIYENPEVSEIRETAKSESDKLWHEVLRFENPHKYYVDLSSRVMEVKTKSYK